MTSNPGPGKVRDTQNTGNLSNYTPTVHFGSCDLLLTFDLAKKTLQMRLFKRKILGTIVLDMLYEMAPCTSPTAVHVRCEHSNERYNGMLKAELSRRCLFTGYFILNWNVYSTVKNGSNF